MTPSEVIVDIDGEVRSGSWDVGADQYSPGYMAWLKR